MNETETLTDEISLLDIVVVIAENWRALVIVPLLAGLIAYFGLSSTSPRQFQSEAVIRTDASGAASFSSARVLNGPILKSELSNRFDRSLSRARQALVDGLRVSKVDGTNLYRVTLIDTHSPEETERFLNDLLQSAIENSTPTDLDRQRLELRAQQLEISIEELQTSFDRINKFADQKLQQEGGAGLDLGFGEVGQAAVAILSNIESRREELFNIQSALAGSISQGDIIQSATLPDSAQPSGLLTKVVLIVLGVGMLVLIGAFIRDGLRRASQDAGALDKVNRIRRAFWMKPLSLKSVVSSR